MKHVIPPLVAVLFAACGGDEGSISPAEDTTPADVLDLASEDTPPDTAPDVPPDTPPDTPLDVAPDAPPDTPPDIPEGCDDDEHDGGDGICVPEGECSHGFADGGDGSCVPEGSCVEGHHDGGDGSCLPSDLCIPGFFNKSPKTVFWPALQSWSSATPKSGG